MQKAMAQLFGVNVTAISKHLKNLFGGRIGGIYDYFQNGNESTRYDYRREIL